MSFAAVGSHYDEETLIRVAESDVEIEDPHLMECDDCRTAVDEYRDMLSCMSDDAVWERPLDETPNAQTIATLRAFVEDMHREDAEAEPLVAELLAGTREEWMPRLMADGKYRTAGVVRKLIGMMPKAVQQMPADAVAVSALARRISDDLAASSAAAQLGGAARREFGFAQFITGDIDAATATAQDAHELLSGFGELGFDVARVDMLRASLYARTDRTITALGLVESAHDAFTRSGQMTRAADALVLKATILAERRAFREALEVTGELRGYFRDVLDDQAFAAILLNEGYYRRETGDFAGALACLDEARQLLLCLDAPAVLARAELNIAVTLQLAGQDAAAGVRLERCIEEFARLGMPSAAALAALHLAELCVMQGRIEQVEELCARVMEQFSASAVAYRERAMTAVAILREASQHRSVSPELVRSVRNYVQILPQQPKLLFAFAPAPDAPNLG